MTGTASNTIVPSNTRPTWKPNPRFDRRSIQMSTLFGTNIPLNRTDDRLLGCAMSCQVTNAVMAAMVTNTVSRSKHMVEIQTAWPLGNPVLAV